MVSHAAKRQREAMVKNLERLIGREYPELAKNTAYLRIGNATGNSLSTMQRIMSGLTGPSIDTLADLAWHLGSTVAEILGGPFPEAQAADKPTKPPRPSQNPPY